jgi:putative colanic acid biosynthesis UDP-glucose lipid carrier transferase
MEANSPISRVGLRFVGVEVVARETTARTRPLREVHPTQSKAPVALIEPVGGWPKRAIDIVGASVGLVALSPLFLLLAIIIRLETRGPSLFHQRRGGYRGRTFLVWKFRTMRTLEDGGAVQQVREDGDPRVTRVGAFMRKTNLDELPQLINVLRGEMSLVGPRPHAVAHDEQFSGVAPRYWERHMARPGITGLAQVSGCRGETRNVDAVRERVKHDLEYIARWSVWLDFAIMARTLRL